MNHQYDKIADENVIFEIIASISCAIIVLAVIIITIHYVKDSSLHSKTNYIKVPTTIKSTNQYHEGKSNSHLSKKNFSTSNVIDREASASKYVNKKCQCDADQMSQIQNDVNNNNVNIRAIQNENGFSRDNVTSKSIRRAFLFQCGSRLNNDQPNDDSFGDEPTLIYPSPYYPSYPGLVSLQPYQCIPYTFIPWGIVEKSPSTSTCLNKPFIQHNQIMNTSKPSAVPQIKKFEDKSSQCLQIGNQPMITSSLLSSLSCNSPKTDSNFYDLEDRKRVRHGVRLNVTLTEHERMMQELHSKALGRIQRLNEDNKKYYQLDIQ